MAQKIRILGILAIIFGLIAAVCSIIFMKSPGKAIVIMSVASGFLGFLCSTIYALLNSKHEVNKHPFNPGVVGMLLSSAPIITGFIMMSSR